MIGGIILLAVLVVSIALWSFLRWWPDRHKARPQGPPTTGARKRWWQP